MVSILITASYILLGSAVVLAMYRLVMGPTVFDRVISLDFFAILIAGMMAVYAVSSDLEVFLDALGTLALVAFIGTVAFARYLEGKISR